jgi:LuxR family maltose regulon positive regulatory protein
MSVPMPEPLPFGRWLKRLRADLDMTQEALAQAVGCAPQTIRTFEIGTRRPSRELAERLADILLVPPEQRADFIRLARMPAGSSPERPRTRDQERSAHGDGHSQHATSTTSAEPARVTGATKNRTEPPPDPILATKVYLPRPCSGLVSRSRLLARLEAGLPRSLTVLAAPAGFGKTTLLADWISQHGSGDRRVAWLALDAGDSDPLRFIRYLIAALQTIDPTVGTATLNLLRAAQSPPLEAVLPFLINELVALPDRSILVLDDYHVIDAPAVHQALAFLLDHLPPPLHLVIASRSDPSLPLARLRARGQLNEVRASDLRFTLEEATTFLRQVMDIPIEAADVAALDAHTEGWIAGLQLAALAMQHNTDPGTFVQAFAGSNRFVIDYLAEEVIERLPAHLQTFVLQTAILDRLCGSLCDTVLGIAHEVQQGADVQPSYSQLVLAELERANLFLIPLDDDRRWYRYHHLFGEVMRTRLHHGASAEHVTALHRRASGWYEHEGWEAEAIQHAVAAADWERVERLLLQIIPTFVARTQFHTVLRWLRALPDALFRACPTLYVHDAGMLMYTNQVGEAEARLQAAEHAIAEAAASGRGFAHERLLRGQIAVIRAAIFRIRGDLERCVALSREALELLPDPETVPLKLRPVAGLNALRAFLVSGDVRPVVEERVASVIAPIRASVNRFALLTSIINLARLQVLQGRLHQAAATYGEAREVVGGAEELKTVIGGAAYYIGLGELHREWNDLAVAHDLLQTGLELVQGRITVDADVLTAGYIAMARLQRAQADPAGALHTMRQFLDIAREREIAEHLLARARAAQALLALQQGALDRAVDWADRSSLRLEDTLSYLREWEYLALARVRIAEAHGNKGSPYLRDAQLLLNRLLQDAEAGGRMDSMLRILILLALLHHAGRDALEAHVVLNRALGLAASGGYIRIFVDKGAPMAALLAEALRQTTSRLNGTALDPSVHQYIHTLLAAFGAEGSMTLVPAHLPSATMHPLRLGVEPLTDREREVLRLLAEGRSNQAIAEELVVAVGTVKRHVSNIMSKLGVQSRLEAVAHARSLNLV